MTIIVYYLCSLKKEMLVHEMEKKGKINEDLVSILADAILKFDLLCVKVSKPVYLDVSKTESGASGISQDYTFRKTTDRYFLLTIDCLCI